MENAEYTQIVGIERGTIKDKKAGPLYKVESATRAGVVSRWMEFIGTYINQWKGDPPTQDRKEFEKGDEVYFFMFSDGRGMILGGMSRVK